MNKLFLASLFILVTLANSSLFRYEETSALWSQWKDQHAKFYSSSHEERMRFATFTDNFHKIENFNAKDNTVKLGLNEFADLTAEEFKNTYSNCYIKGDKDAAKANTLPIDEITAGALPASVDWRNQSVVTPVKNQGQCGACWTFATTGVLEGWYALKNKTLLSFSEQQIVDCDKSESACEGGNTAQALGYTATNGLELESAYPYTAKDGTCKYSKTAATKLNAGYTAITSKSSTALLTALVSSPVAVAIEADQNIFQFYKSGVITTGCGKTLDHAVLVVGYETINGTQAFIVKNSWGASWGQKGYVYISTSNTPNSNEGVCGILADPVIAK